MNKLLRYKSIQYTILFFLTLIIISIFLALYKIPKGKQPITLLIAREPDTLTFLTSRHGISLLMQKALFRGLVEYNDQLELYPELAEEIPRLENGKVQVLDNGKMRIHWTLKKNLKWSDGHPLTSKDVLFTLKLLKNDKIYSASLEKSEAQQIEEIQIIDDRNFVVIWSKVHYEYKTAHPILPEHILKVHLNQPEKFDQITYHRNPIGNGPYILDKWLPGAYLLFKQNPYYHKEVKSKSLAFKIIKDVNTLLLHILTGSGHASSKVSPEQYRFIKEQYKDRIKMLNIQGMGWIHIDLNCDHPILKDKLVRQALLYGMNRQAIVDAVSYGTFFVSKSWLPKKHYGYHEPDKLYSYNPKKAKELLTKAGWNLDGKIRKKNGQSLKLEILADSKDKNRVRFCSFIKEDLKKLGVELTIQTYTTDALFSKYIMKRNFEMALYAWFMIPRIDGRAYWHSNSIPGKGSGANFPGFSDKRIDDIQNELLHTLSLKKRLELFKRHQKIWIEELPALPLFETHSLSAISNKFKNWKPTGSAIPETWNCEEWYFEEDHRN